MLSTIVPLSTASGTARPTHGLSGDPALSCKSAIAGSAMSPAGLTPGPAVNHPPVVNSRIATTVCAS